MGPTTLGFAGIQSVLDNLIARHEVAPLIVACSPPEMDRNERIRSRPASARLSRARAAACRCRPLRGERPTSRTAASWGRASAPCRACYTAWQLPRDSLAVCLLQSGSFVFTDIGHHGRSPLFDPVVKFVNAFRQDPARIAAGRVFLSCGTFESLIWFNRSLGPSASSSRGPSPVRGSSVTGTTGSPGVTSYATGWRGCFRAGCGCITNSARFRMSWAPCSLRIPPSLRCSGLPGSPGPQETSPSRRRRRVMWSGPTSQHPPTRVAPAASHRRTCSA